MVVLSTAASKWQGTVFNNGCGRRWRFACGSALLLLASLCVAQANDEVDALLQRSDAPHGIVFEIVEGDESALEELLPVVRNSIKRIRADFRRLNLPWCRTVARSSRCKQRIRANTRKSTSRCNRWLPRMFRCTSVRRMRAGTRSVQKTSPSMSTWRQLGRVRFSSISIWIMS